MEGADPQLLGHLSVNTRAQLALLHRGQGAPGLAVLALGQALRQKNFKPLLHLAGGFVGEGHRQDLGRIGTVLSDQVSDPMGEGTRFATASTRNHQQRPLVMVHRPSLGVVKAGQKAHELEVIAAGSSLGSG